MAGRARQLAHRLAPVRGIRITPRTVPFNTDGLPGRIDLETERVTGEGIAAGEDQKTYRRHTKGSVTWYKPNWFHGNHEFKAGFDYIANSEIAGTDAKQVNYHAALRRRGPLRVRRSSTPRFIREWPATMSAST